MFDEAKEKNSALVTQNSVLDRLKKKLPESLASNNNFNKLKEIDAEQGRLIEKILDLLQEKQLISLLTQEHFDTYTYVRSSEFIFHFIVLLNKLDEMQGLSFLSSKNFNVLLTYCDIWHLTRLLETLQNAQLTLTSLHFNMLIRHIKRESLNQILNGLHRVRLLSNENFDQLLRPENNFLRTYRAQQIIWDLIPDHLLTQATFDALIEITQQNQPEPALVTYLNGEDLLGRYNHFVIRRPDGFLYKNGVLVAEVDNVNHRQSTHTMSVHRSVSDSAKKLATRYETQIAGSALNKVVNRAKEYISSLARSSLKNKVAKRCIERITDINFTFSDPGSGLSIKQLLALTFLSIHDDEHRTGALKDAQAQFTEGLYDIQRGYNLNENGFDSDPTDQDKPICMAGTFNKLMEKLQSIHPDVEIYFINQAIAAKKLPRVVIQVADDYLSRLAKKAKTAKDFLNFIRLMTNLKKGHIDFMFNAIKDEISECIWDEFKAIYPDKSAPDFSNFIASGVYTNLKPVKNFQPLLENSSAYRDFCSQILYSPRLFSLKNSREQSHIENKHRNPSRSYKLFN